MFVLAKKRLLVRNSPSKAQRAACDLVRRRLFDLIVVLPREYEQLRSELPVIYV